MDTKVLEAMNEKSLEGVASIDWSDPEDYGPKCEAIKQLTEAGAKDQEIQIKEATLENDKKATRIELIKMIVTGGIGLLTLLTQLGIGLRATKKEEDGELILGNDKIAVQESQKGLFRPFKF